jgi:hypothetical protein
VNLEFGGMAAVFDGKVDGGGTQLMGTFRAGNETHPVTLQREDTLAEEQRDAEKDFSHSGPNDLPGHWQGVLAVKGIKLHLKVDIAKLPDDKFDCSMISVDQGGAHIPATAVSFTAPKVRLEWSGIGGVFAGNLKDGKLSGTWTQGGGKFPLIFERVGK